MHDSRAFWRLVDCQNYGHLRRILRRNSTSENLATALILV